MQVRRWQRSGLTIVEVLVATAIIGLLAALSLPAIQVSREASRRSSCLSNLRQLVLASQNYEAAFSVLPGSAFLGGGQWQQQLLEYVEHPGSDWFATIYSCPSDELGLGSICYHVNDGLWPVSINGYARAAIGRYCRSADITDGLSHTAAFADKLATPEIIETELPPDAYPELRIRRMVNTAAFRGDLDVFATECDDRSLTPFVGWYVVWGYNHVLTPNRMSCFNGPQSDIRHMDYMAVTATSRHAAGVNVAMADGGARFVSDSIDRIIWRSIGTRNGNERVSSNW